MKTKMLKKARALWNTGDRRLDRYNQRAWVQAYFFREVMPLLTPLGLDPAHPFPRLLNKSLNFAVELEGKDAFGRSSNAAIVQAPRVLPRVTRMPEEIAGCEYGFVFMSSILHEFVGELFTGMTVLGCYQFRATRNSDLFVDEEEVTNLRTKLQGELTFRHFGDAVRLEVADNCSETMNDFLLTQFGLKEDDLYRVHGPVNLVRLMQVPDWVDRPDLKFPAFVPGLPRAVGKGMNIFASIRRADILLHHPYQSFAPVIEFLNQAANDPQVVAIKMTVYRTGTDSVLMQSLIRAAQDGKEVTAGRRRLNLLIERLQFAVGEGSDSGLRVFWIDAEADHLVADGVLRDISVDPTDLRVAGQRLAECRRADHCGMCGRHHAETQQIQTHRHDQSVA